MIMETRRYQLPREIVHEILTRTPVKSLLRFKCVAKSWCSLISSESFAKAHLCKSSKDRSFIIVNPVVYIGNTPPFWSTTLNSCESLNDLDCLYHQWLGLRRRVYQVVRSCRGLVCCFSICGKDFTLWNPSTRKYLKLPPVDFEKESTATSCGFGYVESTDDYKVFAMSLEQKIEGAAYHCVAKVYSLKSNCWRTVDDNHKLETPMDFTARYLGGVLYWLRPFVVIEEDQQLLRWEIISFDLEEEAFGITVEQPGDDFSEAPTLGVLHGDLCVLCTCVTVGVMVLWVLSKGLNTWTRMATISLPYTCGPKFPTHRMGVGSDGSILRAHELNFKLCYRPNPMLIKSPWIHDLDILDRACAHVESLVSLGDSEEAGICDSIIDLEMIVDRG